MSRMHLQHRLLELLARLRAPVTRLLAAMLVCALFLNGSGTVHAASTLFVNTESFETIDSGNGTTNVELRFGPNSETIDWNPTQNSFTISDDVRVQGILSGVTLYATKSFSGAGLSDCDTGATSKLLWDATTGRFSCGTDQTGGSSGGSYTAGQGLSLNGANAFSIGQTISGTLLEFQTVSGAVVYAERQLSVSGSTILGEDSGDSLLVYGYSTFIEDAEFHKNVSIGDSDTRSLLVAANVTVNTTDGPNGFFNVRGDNEPNLFYVNPATDRIGIGMSDPDTLLEVAGTISGTSLVANDSIFGAGLIDCDTGATSKLLWDASTGRFSCGTDQGSAYTAGQGLTLNGTSFRLNETVTGSVIKATTSLASSGTLVWEGAASGSSLNIGGGNIQIDANGNFVFNKLRDPNVDFNIETPASPKTFFVDSSAQRVGIHSYFADPEYRFDVFSNDAAGWTAKFGGTDASSDAQTRVGLGKIGAFTTGASSQLLLNPDGGNVGIGIATPKAKLSVQGIMSGVTLYATKSFSGAGLSDCDTAGTSKLLWDATTGRFSCGTDQGGSGLSQADADLRFLKLSGGTLTGALTIQNGNTHIPTLSTMLNVRGSISGSLLRAGNMTVSGAVVYSSGNTLMQTAKGLSGQLLIAQGTNAPKWAAPVGGMMWYFDGTQTVVVSKGPQITMPFGLIVEGISLKAKGAPTGAAFIMDINNDGVSIFSTRPQIDAGAITGGGTAVFSSTVIPVNSVLTLDVDQIGSTFAGSGITVMLKGTRQY